MEGFLGWRVFQVFQDGGYFRIEGLFLNFGYLYELCILKDNIEVFEDL